MSTNHPNIDVEHLLNNVDLPRCRYCDSKLIRIRASMKDSVAKTLHPKNIWTRQHIYPKRLGGKNTKDNFKICCKECNTILALLGECPAMLRCLRDLGEQYGYGKGNQATKGAFRRLNLKRNMFV